MAQTQGKDNLRRSCNPLESFLVCFGDTLPSGLGCIGGAKGLLVHVAYGVLGHVKASGS